MLEGMHFKGSGPIRRGLIAAFFCLTLVGILFGGGTASAAPTSDPIATVSQAPSAGAPLSAWQDWAAAQRSVMTVSGWAQSLSSSLSPDCTVSNLQVIPVVSNGKNGIPAGIVTDAVGGSIRCANDSANGSVTNAPVSASPATSSSCPVQDTGTSKSITDGVLCVGTYTYLGNPNFMAASYKNTSSVSPYGQVQLGVGGCPGYSDGRYPIGGPGYIAPGNTWFVAWGPRTFSDEWSSTWYENGTTSWGSVCAYY